MRVGVQTNATLKAIDFFSPYNNEYLDSNDLDLGSAAPIALPSEYFGTPKVPDLLLQPSKEGDMYLLNRDDLGGAAQGPEGKDAVLQTFAGNGGVWDGGAVWPGDGGFVYVPSVSPGGGTGGGGNLRAFKYGVVAETDEPTPFLAARSSETLSFGSGSPIVTSDGIAGGTAVLWITQCPTYACTETELVAYNAVPLGGTLQKLWSRPMPARRAHVHPRRGHKRQAEGGGTRSRERAHTQPCATSRGQLSPARHPDHTIRYRRDHAIHTFHDRPLGARVSNRAGSVRVV